MQREVEQPPADAPATSSVPPDGRRLLVLAPIYDTLRERMLIGIASRRL